MRFLAFKGFGVLAGSAMVDLALVDDSAPIALPVFSEPITWACRGSSPVNVSPVVLEPDAIFSEWMRAWLGHCWRSTAFQKTLRFIRVTIVLVAEPWSGYI